MRTAYLVLGYGVPDDIFTDTNYGTYLRIAFNQIWSDRASETFVWLAGGRTDVRPPYRRTEAGEMLKYLRALAARPAVRQTARQWRLFAYREPLGVPESLSWFVHSVVKPPSYHRTVVFCEKTRQKRIEELMRQLVEPEMPREGHALVLGIDFDVSANRYRPPDEIKEREQAELDLDTWALASPVNLQRHRQLREERLKFLRAAGPKRHVQAIQDWERREPEVRERLGIPI